MPFKTSPSTISVVSNFVSNLPRRFSRQPLTRPVDPEICSATFQTYIRNAFGYVALRVTDINALGGECVKLATCLAGKTVSSVYITCANCGGRPSSSDASEGSIQLCLSAFGWAALDQSTVNGLVLRELIRMCGGTELDAWGLDAYFDYVRPGSPPIYFSVPSYVLSMMCAGGTPGTGSLSTYRVGTFLVWSPFTGVLYAKKLTATPPGWQTTGASLTGNFGNAYWRYP